MACRLGSVPSRSTVSHGYGASCPPPSAAVICHRCMLPSRHKNPLHPADYAGVFRDGLHMTMAWRESDRHVPRIDTAAGL
ncbi:hypothetical protein VFPBJ_00739 [Purpureocillium lilacinum]|uniref:Uncharacterized protein n=1 Tax=Purpureocillium lilacinum TaxID=33203 RepID=A0A179HB87_PURLI|nr:hypothetical protein VFPBJ_00739 [Purpureocillium lilacinum]